MNEVNKNIYYFIQEEVIRYVTLESYIRIKLITKKRFDENNSDSF